MPSSFFSSCPFNQLPNCYANRAPLLVLLGKFTSVLLGTDFPMSLLRFSIVLPM